jgi:hypothetical protein
MRFFLIKNENFLQSKFLIFYVAKREEKMLREKQALGKILEGF